MARYRNTHTGQVISFPAPRARFERSVRWSRLDTAPEAAAGGPPHVDLASLSRRELNELASRRGVMSPQKLPNKAAVMEAIRHA